MKTNPFSLVVHNQLAALDLARIPAPAIDFIESCMVAELAKVAARKISTRFVSRAILATASNKKPASDSTQTVEQNLTLRG
jgi:hypothetical protein